MNQNITIRQVVQYCDTLLKNDALNTIDTALNGLQVGDLDSPVHKIACSVDACQPVFQQASKENVDFLFVHHGLFWGKPFPITHHNYNRIATLIKSNVALYASHLPLDAHELVGNNIQLAKALQLENLSPFGKYKGHNIGFQGNLPFPTSIETICQRLSSSKEDSHYIMGGKSKIQNIAIVSGDAPECVYQTLDTPIDLFISGEPSHEIYHFCFEKGINALFIGHYHSETFGPKAMAQNLKQHFRIETIFIDSPTSL